MTEHRVRLIAVMASTLLGLGYLGLLCWVAVPGFRQRLERGGEWVLYYRWQAWWQRLQPWEREAAQVRGLGPVE